MYHREQREIGAVRGTISIDITIEWKEVVINDVISVFRIHRPRCKAMVTRLESLIFGDFELMSRFANKCLNDIQKFHCGRNQVESAKKVR